MFFIRRHKYHVFGTERVLLPLEVDVADVPEKLEYIGWGPKAPPSPADSPGQPRELNCLTQGKGSILLEWNHPAGGGAVRNYIVEWREQTGGGPFGPWLIAGSSLDNQANLTGQPRAVHLEYRAKAVKTGGESIPSNTVVVVL